MFYTLFKNKYLIFSSILFLISCQTDAPKSTDILLSNDHKVILLDSVDASKAIVRDDIDKFFDHIQALDETIQMKLSSSVGAPYPLSMSRDSHVILYKNYLQKDVGNFTKEERDFVAKAIQETYQLIGKVSLKYFPNEIKIIKTRSRHYDSDMYYTRENVIVLPELALKQRNYALFLQTILHEVSHIITRLNPALKAQLYALIDFKRIETPIELPIALQRRLLTNPDGVDINWARKLTSADGKTVFALPLIYAKDTVFHVEKPDYADYLGWNYFELVPSTNNKNLVVLTQGDRQQSTLNTQGINDLFKQNYNTSYIIHPDEIIADNFAFLMLSSKNPTLTKDFTEGGKILLEKMKNTLIK